MISSFVMTFSLFLSKSSDADLREGRLRAGFGGVREDWRWLPGGYGSRHLLAHELGRCPWEAVDVPGR